MKRLVSFSLVLLLIIGLTGCANKTKYINSDDVKESTMLARSNGSLQVATVEKFDKKYYNLTELNDFIGKEVVAYNDTIKAENIKINKIDVREVEGVKCAVMLLSYASMKDYSEFNSVMAAYFHGGVKNVTFELPEKLVNAKHEVLTNTSDVIENTGFRVLVVTEPLHIVVDGKVQFYSENVKKIDGNEVRSSAEGMSVIVYKP